MKHTALIISALLMTAAVFAQDVAFTVLAAKGNALAQRSDDPDNYTQLKAGVEVFSGDKIIISGNQNYVGLVNANGNSVELKKSGVYNSNELLKALEMNEGTLAQKYVDFLVKDMSKESEAAAHNMSTAGAVDRSTESAQLKLFLPESVEAVPGKTAVKWMKDDRVESYTVTLSNMFDEEVVSKNVSDNVAEFDFSDSDIKPGEVLKINVSANDDSSIKSKTSTIKFADQEKTENIKKETSSLGGNKNDLNAVEHVVLGSYYKKNGFYLNALNHFLQAKNLEPEVEAYNDMYNKLLYSMGI